MFSVEMSLKEISFTARNKRSSVSDDATVNDTTTKVMMSSVGLDNTTVDAYKCFLLFL